MSAHTPGPWFWSNVFLTTGNQKTWTLVGAEGYGILSCDGTENSPQGLGERGKFDARLIAAAPEMLDLLQQVVDPHNEASSDADLRRNARIIAQRIVDLIAKIEGAA